MRLDWTVSVGNLLSMATMIAGIMGLYFNMSADIAMLKEKQEAILKLQQQVTQLESVVMSVQRDVAVIKDRMEFKR